MRGTRLRMTAVASLSIRRLGSPAACGDTCLHQAQTEECYRQSAGPGSHRSLLLPLYTHSPFRCVGARFSWVQAYDCRSEWANWLSSLALQPSQQNRNRKVEPPVLARFRTQLKIFHHPARKSTRRAPNVIERGYRKLSAVISSSLSPECNLNSHPINVKFGRSGRYKQIRFRRGASAPLEEEA
jgi:hypothetical protein